MAFFSSAARTDTRTEIGDRILNQVPSDRSQAVANTIGGIKVTGGGKKSSTNVTNNIQFADFGAISAAEKIALKGLEFAGDTQAGSVSSNLAALDFGKEALGSAQRAFDRSLEAVEGVSAGAVAESLTQVLLLAGVVVAGAVFLFRRS